MTQEIQNIRTELDLGYRTVTVFRKKRKIKLTPGRRRMLELRLRRLQSRFTMLWISKEPVFGWDADGNRYRFKYFRIVNGTYCRDKHGPLNDLKPSQPPKPDKNY